MSKLHTKRIVKELESIDLNSPTLLFMLFDLIDATSKVSFERIDYSKSYFSRYYCVDLDTFHKWIRVFCPDLWDNEYKRKRKFTRDEANYILEKLGRLSFDKIPPQHRKDLMIEIYKNKSWKKSRQYEEICLELDGRFPDESLKLNKLPPIIMFRILEEEIENYNKTITSNDEWFYRDQIHVFQTVLSKYKRVTMDKEEVYRRYLRRWFSVKNKSSDD